MGNSEVTLQINLSPGDVQYARRTVPAIVNAHKDINYKILIVDCCKPQKTKLVNPELRFPEPVFSNRVEEVVKIAEEFKLQGLFDEVYYLKPGDPLYLYLSKKYLNNLYSTTHGAGGTAQMAYWAAIELPKTRYVIHFDGDMLFYQSAGYKWWEEAVGHMKHDLEILFAIPRHAPPTTKTGDMPTYREGMQLTSHKDYWLQTWFSTRLFLVDRERLEKYLPLVKGKLKFELYLRKYLKRAFPLDPEIILFRTVGLCGSGKRLILKSENAWSLHPHSKPKEFVDALPIMISYVNNGIIPEAQKGREDILLDDWLKFIND